jgi:F0F1-type ATP synthase assembly protein I
MPRQLSTLVQQAGLLTAIPCVLFVGPVLGYLLGTAVDRRWPFAPWGLGVGIILGLAASGRVTAQLIRQAQELGKRHD